MSESDNPSTTPDQGEQSGAAPTEQPIEPGTEQGGGESPANPGVE